MSVTISKLIDTFLLPDAQATFSTIDELVGQTPSPFTPDNLKSLITLCETSKNIPMRELVKAFFEFILDKNPNITVGHDPLLLWACDKSMPNMAAALLTAGANPNVADVNGDTPLLVACDRSLAPVAIQLINKGANVNATNNLKMTPMTICNRREDMDSVISKLTTSTSPAPALPALPALPAPDHSDSTSKSLEIGDIVEILDDYNKNIRYMYVTEPSKDGKGLDSYNYVFNITKYALNTESDYRKWDNNTKSITDEFTLTSMSLSDKEQKVYSIIKSTLNETTKYFNRDKETKRDGENRLLELLKDKMPTTPIVSTPVRVWISKNPLLTKFGVWNGGNRRLRLKSAAE
jgi:hypothetical protein